MRSPTAESEPFGRIVDYPDRWQVAGRRRFPENGVMGNLPAPDGPEDELTENETLPAIALLSAVPFPRPGTID
jgi:hypothetical protein